MRQQQSLYRIRKRHVRCSKRVGSGDIGAPGADRNPAQ